MEGIEFLRNMISAYNYCREEFLMQYTSEELIAIRKAWLSCEWDIYPDQWSKSQIARAIQGEVPKFTDEGNPIEPNNL